MVPERIIVEWLRTLEQITEEMKHYIRDMEDMKMQAELEELQEDLSVYTGNVESFKADWLD